MQFLILSDLHANWEALSAVLEDAEGQYEQVICCGDLVGYNPDPERVLDWTRTHCRAVVRGNHDKVVAGIEGLEWFNDVAQAAARWTVDQLNREGLDYLRGLRQGPAQLQHFHIWHGSPADEDQYIIHPHEAQQCFARMELPLGFFGHTHLQGGFSLKGGRLSSIPQVRRAANESQLFLHPDAAYIINPGSVGQPRDTDPRASYAVYDSEERRVTLRRVCYDVDKTTAAILDAGLPEVLGLRLYKGI